MAHHRNTRFGFAPGSLFSLLRAEWLIIGSQRLQPVKWVDGDGRAE